MTGELENPNSFFYFIYHDDQVAGYLKLNINDAQTEGAALDALEIERIYIRQPFKRLGLGTQLINHALAVAQQTHKTNVWLGVCGSTTLLHLAFTKTLASAKLVSTSSNLGVTHNVI